MPKISKQKLNETKAENVFFFNFLQKDIFYLLLYGKNSDLHSKFLPSCLLLYTVTSCSQLFEFSGLIKNL